MVTIIPRSALAAAARDNNANLSRSRSGAFARQLSSALTRAPRQSVDSAPCPRQNSATAYTPLVATPTGPAPAKRPDEATLEYLKNDDVKIEDRQALARTLSLQGYSIDVPIDVWGWDPVKTNALRAMYGYTWVPNATGTPVTVAPGLGMPGAAAYDPQRPPDGAILVPPPPQAA